MNRNHVCILFFVTLIVTVVALVLLLRRAPDEEEPLPLGAALNQFAFNLYDVLDQKNGGSGDGGGGGLTNIFYSPLSISSAFSVLLLGARGQSREQIFYGLALNESATDPDDVPRAFQKLLKSLDIRSSDESMKGVELTLANKILVQKGFEVKSKFKKQAKVYFRVDVEDKDFALKADKVLEDINTWIKEKTGGHIKELFDQPLSQDTKMAILNAIYFNGTWLIPFDVKETSPLKFNNQDKSTSIVQVMYSKAKYGMSYNEEKGFRLLELKYNQEVSMFIILPQNQEGLPQLMKSFRESDLVEAINKTQEFEMVVMLPKFHLETTYDLKEILTEIGLGDLFQVGRVDLTGISSKSNNLALSGAIHKAVIDVSEAGTTAAAATGITIEGRSGTPQFIVDRPFAFFIRNTNTSVNYFVGRVSKL